MSLLDAPLALDWVLSDLYEAEINCGVESFWDGGFTVFIGDEMNGRAAEDTFYPDGNTYGHLPLSEAGNWLWLMSRHLYPIMPQHGGPKPSCLAAQAIEAQRAETENTGSVADESAVAESDAPKGESRA